MLKKPTRPQDHPLTGPSEFIKDPPVGWWESLRFLGPGLIVIGAVIGSGELVVTTLLGARVGFVMLWLVILSCLLKVILQEQLTYYIITSEGTILDAFNRLPGLKIRGLSWLSWVLFTAFVLGWFSVGGIVGMAASALVLLTGWGNTVLWTVLIAVASVLFLLRSNYGRIERLFLSLVACFSFSVIVALCLTQGTDFAIVWPDLLNGFGFQLPREAAYIALAVFGATGINGYEIVYYTYWCLEKGYGRYVGPPDGTPEWRERALGWITVMRRDVLLTAGLYTGITIAFYLLGAAILHRAESDAASLEGLDAALALSNMFTQSFGRWSFGLFMIGSILVLYSTYLSTAVSSSRVFGDFLERLKILSASQTAESRNRWYNWFSIFLCVLFVVIYFFIRAPVALILFGGIIGALFLPVLGFATIYLVRNSIRPELRPPTPHRVLLWICSSTALVLVSASLYLQFAP